LLTKVVRLGELGSLPEPRDEDPAPVDRGKWLRDGNVVYKSVGVGLMDLAVGNHLVKVAREKGVGTTIENF
jgi:hypothetical protein